MFTRLNRRPHTIVPRDTFSLGTLPFAPINESPRQNPGAGSSGGILYLNRDLGISAIGTASLDYSHETLPIKPRSVVKMDWFSEQLGDKHEHIVLRVSDKRTI
ncbi:hypothetical protein BDV93DRAFT_524005 [Ceratobasidium sp. AG-I]|nr:hypothetical protein BDV93DRAFT_524005 [Ceratobasidium sp. AG-I]